MKRHLTTWENYSRFSDERGQLVAHLLKKHLSLKDARILDIGCGIGSTAAIFTKYGALVYGIDITNQLNPKNNFPFALMAGENLGFKNSWFDAVILQDVLEHTEDPQKVLSEINRVLKNNGVFFINTPNRLSPVNFMSDPHWGMPVVSIFPRKWVKLFIRDILRKDRRVRQDWPALVGLFQLKALLLKHKFTMHFENKTVAKYLFQAPNAVVCSKTHLQIVALLKSFRCDKLITKFVNNKFGCFNYFVNPTWYIICFKREV